MASALEVVAGSRQQDGVSAIVEILYLTFPIKTNPFPILEKSMARNNFVFEYGEISEDIYYDLLKRDGKSTPICACTWSSHALPMRRRCVVCGCVYGSDAICGSQPACIKAAGLQ